MKLPSIILRKWAGSSPIATCLLCSAPCCIVHLNSKDSTCTLLKHAAALPLPEVNNIGSPSLPDSILDDIGISLIESSPSKWVGTSKSHWDQRALQTGRFPLHP